MTGAKIRVLVVEDSITVRRHLCAALAEDPGLEVVGDVGDGRAAIEACLATRPDVITMDMALPVMSGLAATEYIMAHCPTPVLIVSASTNRGNLHRIYEALAAGAVDVLEKPRGDEPAGAWERQLRAAVRMVSRISVITHVRARLNPSPRRPARPSAGGGVARAGAVVALGASTGGPSAIARILRGLPTDYPLPVLALIHVGAAFAPGLTRWLSDQTALAVAEAQDGESIAAAAGRVLVAPAGRHLVVRGRRVAFTGDDARHHCRPSIDVLFESIAVDYGPDAVACLLTGMGRDGAAGLRAIRDAGGQTIAQDEASSIVYGMPREAAALGAAERILSLDDIARAVAALTAKPRREPR